MNLNSIFLWLGLMLRCAYMPWKSWELFIAYDRSKEKYGSKYMIASGLFLFYATGVIRNYSLEGRPLTPLLMKMSVVIFGVMLASFKSSMMLAGISSGVDLFFVFLFIVGIKINPWLTGFWEIIALIISFYSVYKAKSIKQHTGT